MNKIEETTILLTKYALHETSGVTVNITDDELDKIWDLGGVKAEVLNSCYDENGKAVEHVVWFENANSIRALLQLVETFGINGIGVWNGMRYFPQLWQVLNHTYRIRKVLG